MMGSVGNVSAAFGSMSVIIPAYNAQEVVCSTLDAVQTYLDGAGLAHEVIVVDDGSGDATAARVEQRGRGVAVLRNERNRGKGYTVRRGLLAARCEWALFMDVDNSTSIAHLDRFAAQAREADVMIASRRVAGARIVRRQPRLRQMLGRTFPYFVRLLALREVQDTQCGFKVFRREVVQAVFPRVMCEGFCFDVEALLVARRLGYRIAELPVDWDNPPVSTVRVSLDPLRMLGDLVRIVWRHRASRYAAGGAPGEAQRERQASG